MNKIISKRERQKSFRIQNKKLFLTYSQCKLSLTNVLAQLQDRLKTFGVENYLLVTEDHDDRSVNVGVRIHVFLTCNKLANLRNSACLDLRGDDGEVYHGNYQACKNDVHVIEYCLKDVVDLTTILVSKDLRFQIFEKGLMMPAGQSRIKLAEGSEFNTPYFFSFVNKITSMKKKISNTKTEKNFKLQGKLLFLTYPQCALQIHIILKQLQNSLATYGITDYLIVKEEHGDLFASIGVHIHVFLACRKRVCISNSAHLDLRGDDGKVYHGNYQTCHNDKNAISVIKYCLKDVVYMGKVGASKDLRKIISSWNLVDQSRLKDTQYGDCSPF